jgi:hypothetical protein
MRYVPCERRSDSRYCGIDLRQDCPGVFEHRLSSRQETYAAGRSFEERYAQFLLEIADLTSKRRLRDVQARGSSRQVTLFGDGHEVFELRKTHGSRLPWFAPDAKPHARHIEMQTRRTVDIEEHSVADEQTTT